MRYALCIIAKDEETTIGRLVEQIAQQSILRRQYQIDVIVVSNGCTDRTASVAHDAFAKCIWPVNVTTKVYDTPDGGKARSWNLAVHELIDSSVDIVIFLDADIEMADQDVLADLIDELEGNANLLAVSGWPLKDIAKKSRKSLVDKFSLGVSEQTSFPHSINGSLYAVRMIELQRIWLPVPIPGEDGMLTAMLHTEGFSQPAVLERVGRASRPTHFFEAHSVAGFFQHEQRMAIGTTINGWLCEHFWDGDHKEHVGKLVRYRNMHDPNWVNDLISVNVGNRFWALPIRLLTWRLNNLREMGFGRMLLRAPLSIAATLLNIWPCVLANRTLKKRAAASYW